MKQYRAKETARVGNYLGLAQKAGQIAAGDLNAQKALKAGKALLLVLAEDSAPNSLKELLFLAERQAVPVLWWPDKLGLGLLVGKSQRGALALLDEGFAKAVRKCCTEKLD